MYTGRNSDFSLKLRPLSCKNPYRNLTASGFTVLVTHCDFQCAVRTPTKQYCYRTLCFKIKIFIACRAAVREIRNVLCDLICIEFGSVVLLRIFLLSVFFLCAVRFFRSDDSRLRPDTFPCHAMVRRLSHMK